MTGNEPIYVIKVGDKEVVIDEKTLEIIREYLHRPMSLDELTRKLGFEGWDETYEFIKKVPAWIIWTPPALWKYRAGWIQRRKVKESESK